MLNVYSDLKYGNVLIIVDPEKEEQNPELINNLVTAFPSFTKISIQDYATHAKHIEKPAFILFAPDELKEIFDQLDSEQRKKVILIDHSYFGGDTRKKVYRIVVGWHIPQTKSMIAIRNDFITRLGVNIDTVTNSEAFVQYSEERRHILVAVPDRKAELFYGVNTEEWKKKVAESVKAGSDGLDYEIIWRDRKSESSLQEDFDKSFLTISYNSALAVEAVLQGIPSIATENSPWDMYTIDNHKHIHEKNGVINITPNFILNHSAQSHYQLCLLNCLGSYCLLVEEFSNKEKVIDTVAHQLHKV